MSGTVIEEGPNLEQIKNIISSHLPDYKPEKIIAKALAGLTNFTYKIQCEGHQSLVFRKFSDIYDRDLQNKVFKILQNSGIAPKCIYACKLYRIQKFIQKGVHPSLQQLKNKQTRKRILDIMYKYHQQDVQILKGKPIFTQYILSKELLQKIQSHKDDSKQQKFQTFYEAVIKQYSQLQALRSQFIETDPEQKSKKIRFCHNDLNNLNIFFEPQTIFIDYEYSSYNYLAFDIANFLNETKIDYRVKNYPCFEQLGYLSEEDIKETASLYPGYYKGLQVDIVKGLAICNLYWAAWSIFMAYDKSNANFGTIQHGLIRLKLFNHYKSLL